MSTKMRRFIEKALLAEAPGNNAAGASNAGNIGDFASTFNTASNTSNLNISGDLNANSMADNNIEVDDSFDDFNYESDFNSPSSSFGGGSDFGGSDFANDAGENGAAMPNTKVLIQTITDYFPNEGTVELTNEEGNKTIKPLAQVKL